MAAETVIARHSGPRAFLDRAESWLLRREAEHNLILGVTTSLARGGRGDLSGPNYFATVERNGGVVGCALGTPPWKIVLTRMPPPAVPALVHDVAEVYDGLPAALGPIDEVAAFGEAWAALRSVTTAPGMKQRIYELKRVDFPTPLAPGAIRMADPDDRPLVVRWLQTFFETTGDPRRDPARAAAGLLGGEGRRSRLALWEDGVPVSMAGISARTRHGVRIGIVYTPREHRRNGYASALVATLSRQVLDSGFSHCTLYADLANPTSNKIYRAIGYRPVQDVMDVLFE